MTGSFAATVVLVGTSNSHALCVITSFEAPRVNLLASLNYQMVFLHRWRLVAHYNAYKYRIVQEVGATMLDSSILEKADP